jgi:hypothetical protein
VAMNTTKEIEQPSIDYCGIADQRLLTILAGILVQNQIPDHATHFEREMVLGLLAYEHDGGDGRKSYHLSIRGHLVYDLLANNGKFHLENGDEKW